jgi:hypothetical protein
MKTERTKKIEAAVIAFIKKKKLCTTTDIVQFLYTEYDLSPSRGYQIAREVTKNIQEGK